MFWSLIVATVVMLPLASPGQRGVALADEVHEGKVIAVASDSITIMDSKDDDLDKFVVTSATTITRNGKPAKLSDVQISDRAKVTVVPEGTKLVAKSIAVTAAE